MRHQYKNDKFNLKSNKYNLKTMPRPVAVYNVSDSALSELPLLIKIQKLSGVKDFVIALLKGVKVNNSQELTREQLSTALSSHKAKKTENSPEKPLSTANSMVSRRIKELESLGCVKVKSEYRKIGEGRRKYTVHEFISFEGLLQYLRGPTTLSPAPQGRPKNNDLIVYSEFLENKGLIKLEADGQVVPYAEGAFSILESASRSKYDNDEVIRCRYIIKRDDYVDITASTSTKEGSGIMFSSDLRVIHTLNGMLKQSYHDQQADMFDDDFPVRFIGEYCFFDLTRLTAEIGLAPNVKENRENVARMIERLKDTTYDVDATHSEYWRQKYMPNEGFSRADYRYITEFYQAEAYFERHGDNGLPPDFDKERFKERFYVVKFHSLIYKAMTTPKLAFISHDSLKSERLDMVHRLNNWVKPVVGVRQRSVPQDHHQYTLDIFHQRVRPASRLDNFERQFLNMARRQNKKEIRSLYEETREITFGLKGELVEGGIFWLNGYYFKIEINAELAKEIYRKTRTIKKRRKKIYPVITIWRDVKDKIVGDDSDHNRALKRQVNELESNLSFGNEVSWNSAKSKASMNAQAFQTIEGALFDSDHGDELQQVDLIDFESTVISDQ